MYTASSKSLLAAIVQAIVRALVGIPCHSMWGYISGAFLCEAQLDGIMPSCCHMEFMFAALWRSIMLHGSYDCLLMLMPLFWKCPLPADCDDVCKTYGKGVSKSSKFVCFASIQHEGQPTTLCSHPEGLSDNQCMVGKYCEQVTTNPVILQVVFTFGWILFITALSFWLARKRAREVREKYASAAANGPAAGDRLVV